MYHTHNSANRNLYVSEINVVECRTKRYLYIENFGRTKIMELKITYKCAILKFVGDLSLLIRGERYIYNFFFMARQL